jgi:hypothetical protein
MRGGTSRTPSPVVIVRPKEGEGLNGFAQSLFRAPANAGERGDETPVFIDGRLAMGGAAADFRHQPAGGVMLADEMGIGLGIGASAERATQNIGAGGVDTAQLRQVEHQGLGGVLGLDAAQRLVKPANGLHRPVPFGNDDEAPVLASRGQADRLRFGPC